MAEPELLKALSDNDWEIVHKAVEELGKRGTQASHKPLVDMAVARAGAKDPPGRRGVPEIRRGVAGAEAVARRLKGDDLWNAADALAEIGEAGGVKQLERMLKQKDPQRRIVAVHALGSMRDAVDIERWTKMLGDGDLRVRAAVMNALVSMGKKAALAPLRDQLKNRISRRSWNDARARGSGGCWRRLRAATRNWGRNPARRCWGWPAPATVTRGLRGCSGASANRARPSGPSTPT